MNRPEHCETSAAAPSTAEESFDKERLPRLSRDPSFWGMTLTQLLGAFNDTIFKQIVLLLLVHVALTPGGPTSDQQSVALALFSAPFILFSGSAGWLADRIRKRRIIVGMKVVEIAIMLGGVAAFATMRPLQHGADGQLISPGIPWAVLAVLFLMGMQSAVFGPAKYGILPEMVRRRDLPAFNGMINMTTFLALIFGVGIGGFLLDAFETNLWMASAVCVGIAVVGTLTSLVVRGGPPAKPDLPFTVDQVAISRETWRLIRDDRTLRGALFAYALFWFVGGIVQPSVNAVGKEQFGLSNTWTSIMAASMGLGIASGCILAGKLSHKQVNFRLVTIGTVGMMVCLAALAVVCPLLLHVDPATPLPAALQLFDGSPGQLLGFYAAFPLLAVAGLFAGLYAVPLQVFLQTRPPEDQKGRMIGSMNLINWIAIIGAALAYGVATLLVRQFNGSPSAVFFFTAASLGPVLVLFRPKNVAL